MLFETFPKLQSFYTCDDEATSFSTLKFLGRRGSYGLSCKPRRFNTFSNVRTCAPETEHEGVYLTGQDILMPGVVSALHTAVMTCRAVERVSLWDTITKNDIVDRLRRVSKTEKMSRREHLNIKFGDSKIRVPMNTCS